MAKILRKDFKKSIMDIRDILEKEIAPVGELGKEERKEKAKSDFWFFATHYLPHYFADESAEFHKDIINKIQGSSKNIAVAAPRGFSKSTLVSFAFPIWNIIREAHRFIIIVSATDDLAENLSDFIRLELTDNERLKEDFGILLVNQGSAGDFIAKKTRIFSRGRKQAVRGFRFREHRPDLIIIDDIEKDEESLSPKVVMKSLKTLTNGLMPALKPEGKFIIVGTILGKRSVCGTIFLTDDEPWSLWDREIYRALQYDAEGSPKSLWENRFSTEFLLSQKALMGTTAFNQEYQNQPTDEGSAMFDLSMIIEGSYNTADPMVLFIDPSVDGMKRNDYKAAVLVAKSGDRFIVVDTILLQGADGRFFDAVCDLYKKHGESVISVTVECISFMKYFVDNLREHAKERGCNLPIQTTSSSLKKEYRIAKLQPLFETGRIFFDPDFKRSRFGKLLIEQLIYFPASGIHDDGPDALAGAIAALDKKTRKAKPAFFFPIKKIGL